MHRDIDAPSSDVPQPLAATTTTIMSIAAGLAVANVYLVHPLLDLMGASLSMTAASLGLAVTLTQSGYAIGLILLVPIGDVMDRRRLIVAQTGLSALALAGRLADAAPDGTCDSRGAGGDGSILGGIRRCACSA